MSLHCTRAVPESGFVRDHIGMPVLLDGQHICIVLGGAGDDRTWLRLIDGTLDASINYEVSRLTPIPVQSYIVGDLVLVKGKNVADVTGKFISVKGKKWIQAKPHPNRPACWWPEDVCAFYMKADNNDPYWRASR